MFIPSATIKRTAGTGRTLTGRRLNKQKGSEITGSKNQQICACLIADLVCTFNIQNPMYEKP
jgi:hypothetical protein